MNNLARNPANQNPIQCQCFNISVVCWSASKRRKIVCDTNFHLLRDKESEYTNKKQKDVIFTAGTEEEVRKEHRKVVDVHGREVVVFAIRDTYYALDRQCYRKLYSAARIIRTKIRENFV